MADVNSNTNEPEVHRIHPVMVRAVNEGAHEVPPASERPLLVCKPTRVEPWRLFKIMSEFVEGFEVLRRYGLAATFFGSARCSFDDAVYQEAEQLAAKLAKHGFAIISGGSSGIMQAANKGAYEAGGASIGLNIRLDDNQGYNKYLTEKYEFDHFFVRKVMLTFASEVYIYFPGGFGTLDEFFEIVTLIQTKKLKRIPVVLVGKEFWTPVLTLIEQHLYKAHGAIDASDMEIYKLVDSVDEAYEYITTHVTC